MYRLPTPYNVLSHHTPDEWVPSLLQDEEDEKKVQRL